MSSELDQLVEMGFEREKAQLALQNGGNLTGAIDWLDTNAEKTAGQEAMSMVCNDCGRKLPNMAAAQVHAERTGHDDFSESAEEIAPLTEEEKKQKLQEVREKLAAKRAGQAEEDKAEKKRNEEIRKKHTKEAEDAKEELQRKEQIKEAAKKKQEKADDIAAKKRIKEKIEADKLARKRKQEEEKIMRNNPAAYNPGAATAPAGGAALVQPRLSTNHSEARLRLQTPAGTITRTFAAETTLFEVAHAVEQEVGGQPKTFTQNFPKKTFTKEDFGMTLKEAGMLPSSALIVQ